VGKGIFKSIFVFLLGIILIVFPYNDSTGIFFPFREMAGIVMVFFSFIMWFESDYPEELKEVNVMVENYQNRFKRFFII